jgi:hypothetical protein
MAISFSFIFNVLVSPIEGLILEAKGEDDSGFYNHVMGDRFCVISFPAGLIHAQPEVVWDLVEHEDSFLKRSDAPRHSRLELALGEILLQTRDYELSPFQTLLFDVLIHGRPSGLGEVVDQSSPQLLRRRGRGP